MAVSACGFYVGSPPSRPSPSPPNAESPAPATPSATSARIVLAPATTAPAVDECDQQLAYAADGNVSPLACSDGRLNVRAWRALAQDNPSVMTLGPYATPAQVHAAACMDVQRSTIPIEQSVVDIATIYYGWQFGTRPGSDLSSTC
ncbi:MAG: hypothetical protein ACYDAY_02145 [Candidatus Dormibacteria bacterium]